jgi:hypothetical protein
MVRLVPVSTLAGPRPLGLLADRVREAADCWDQDPELEELFYGPGIDPEGSGAGNAVSAPADEGDAHQ